MVGYRRLAPAALALAAVAFAAAAAGCRTTVAVDPARAARYGGAPALERARSLAKSVGAIAGGWGNKGRQWAVERRIEELGLASRARVEWVDWWTPQKNVIVEVPGTIAAAATATAGALPAPLVYVVAHYDKFDIRPDAVISRLILDWLEPLLSWSYMSSGAVDNATGCAVALELAREVARRPRPETYRFVLFGSEESGLRGSRCYVAGLDPADVARTALVVNLDSVGIEGEPNGVITGRCDEAAVARALEIAKRRGFPLEPWDLPLGLATSDHEPFWATSFPIDLLRGLQFNLALFFLPQRSWFTSLKQMPIIAFASPGCFDWTDIVAGLVALPIGTIHGPRDRVGRVDAWRLYEQYEIVRELLEPPAAARPERQTK